ncbi:hypothetical protein [Catenovulum agarivorans]|uniref:hypothetical protein n=1 Tax=Catenovulum agarivorans TaxID=1172192 RepID=UPI00031755FC|nr:hypothetical protein [Catenovulum agarivorans]
MKGSIVALSVVMLCIVGLLSFFLRQPANSPESAIESTNSNNTRTDATQQPESVNSTNPKTTTEKQINQSLAECKNTGWQLDNLQQIQSCITLLTTKNPSTINDLLNLYKAWAALDLNSALVHLMAQPAEVSSYLIYDVISAASADNLNSVLNWLDSQTLEESVKSDLLISAYVGASEHNQASILALAENLSDANLKTQIMDSILVNWAQVEYTAVLEWIEGRERSNMYYSVINKLILNLLEQQPAEALYYLELMPQNPQKTILIARYAHTVAKQDLNSALTWAITLNEPIERAAALNSILDLAVAEPQNHQFAWQLALNEAEPNMQQHLLLNVAQNIANQDVLWLVEKFDAIPKSNQAEIARIIVKKWREIDEEAANNWANTANTANSL